MNDAIDGMDKKSSVNIRCVGHTHIDVAWLWRLKHTREKCSRSFSTVLRLMEQYPEYIFLQTQPQLYEYMKEEFPEIYKKIKERVAQGRWEADGGMWVEADCNLTSGESLTRQILLGSKFIMDEFGKDVEYLWLPDVFGYSWALPQILKKAGINTFMTTKISWNQYNRMPHDTFKWKGIDGSQVLTHFITTPEPWNEPDSWFYTYNGNLIPRTVKGTWDAYSEKQMNKDLLIAFGYGDGGGCCVAEYAGGELAEGMRTECGEEMGTVYSFGVRIGASYAAKNIPHVPYEQGNKEMYPIIQSKTALIRDILDRYVTPVSGIRERGIETGVFENGMVIVNHRSTPYILPEKYKVEKYQYPYHVVVDGKGVLAGHEAVWVSNRTEKQKRCHF